MSDIIIRETNLSNSSIINLLIEGTRNQTLYPETKTNLILRNDNFDIEDDKIDMLLKVYHTVLFKTKREDNDITKNKNNKNEKIFDQAMYRNILEDTLGDVALKNFMFVENRITQKISLINTRIKRQPPGDMKKILVDAFRDKKVKYAKISDNPKAHVISELYEIDINDIKEDHLKYYVTKTDRMYQPFNNVPKQNNNVILEFMYMEVLDRIGGIFKDPYFNNLIKSKKISDELQMATKQRKRIDELDLSEEIKNILCVNYVKYRPTSSFACIIGDIDDNKENIYSLLKEHGNIYCIKKYYDMKKMHAILFWLYASDMYSYDMINKIINDHKEKGVMICMTIIIFDFNKKTLSLTNLKSELNDKLERSNKKCFLHLNDYHSQTVECAKLLHNVEHSNFIEQNYDYFGTDQKSNLLLQTFRKYIHTNLTYDQIDGIVCVGNMKNYAMGVGNIDNIHIIKHPMTPNIKLDFVKEITYDLKSSNILTDPSKFFYFQGLKILVEFETF